MMESVPARTKRTAGNDPADAEAIAVGPENGLPARPERLILFEGARFVRAHWLKFFVSSVCALIPCFWQREIASDDLASHVYNAWLVQLIRQGHAPGLWIAPLRTNVLFDWLLSGSGSLVGLRAGEKLAVSLAVLIFFWGAFGLVSAATRRAPWFLLPCIAMVTYGWTFYIGFFNYYLSLGLSFFALAIVWRGKGWERLAAVPFALVALAGHPIGFFWLLGTSVYVILAGILPRRHQGLLFAGGIAALLGMHHYLWGHYAADPGARPFWVYNGADQLVLFSDRYHIPERALVAFALSAMGIDAFRRRRERDWFKAYAIPLQLYVLVGFAVIVLPGAIHFPPPRAALALLTDRLTSISAVLACCLLGAMRPMKWHFVVSGAIAAIFFVFMYQDTRTINRMEEQIVQLVRTLPPDQRVVATVLPLPGSRIPIQHIADRACIGHCFAYGNYEPGSQDFRVRAEPGNPYVLDDYELAIDVEEGTYIVQPEDLPLYQVYQCSESGTELCIRSLKAGEENNRLGAYHDE
jgi:hypothetical protein